VSGSYNDVPSDQQVRQVSAAPPDEPRAGQRPGRSRRPSHQSAHV